MGVKNCILYHYRRAGRDPDLREFIVVMEKDGKRYKVGEVLNIEGTFHKPKEIFHLIEDGWKPIAVLSCFRWSWEAYRYISPLEARFYRHVVDEDRFGRVRVIVHYDGFDTKISVFEGEKVKNYHEKIYFNMATFEEKVVHTNIPEEIKRIFDETEWMPKSVETKDLLINK
ncbi:MAG: hypothetical protein QXT67_04830 [Candidatus Bathyarchaeia archaeon]